MTYDDEHHRFAFVNMAVLAPDGADTRRQGSIGVDHVAYTYSSLTTLLETFDRLKGHGIAPYWCIHHGFTVALYYADPDGNQMEFQVDCFETSDEATAYMNGPRFSANPLGIEFDPAEWLSRLQAGTSERELLLNAPIGPPSPLRGEIASFLGPR